ncbi:MAG: type II toxin-antitoxin system prevent-host-death family antitoxin [Desulfovibrio sp.]|nr:MAG: type II toxin-antitoxin system prevent-host-death family antitoxin [Desulfovibrio sp.]
MKTILDIRTAEPQLKELVAQAEAGAKIVITRDGKAVARLLPVAQVSRSRSKPMPAPSHSDHHSAGEEYFEPIPPEYLAE